MRRIRLGPSAEPRVIVGAAIAAAASSVEQGPATCDFPTDRSRAAPCWFRVTDLAPFVPGIPFLHLVTVRRMSAHARPLPPVPPVRLEPTT